MRGRLARRHLQTQATQGAAAERLQAVWRGAQTRRTTNAFGDVIGSEWGSMTPNDASEGLKALEALGPATLTI